MTRQLAQDALRYVSRTYADERKQYDKMAKRHGAVMWLHACQQAGYVWTDHGDRECMAVLQDMVERAICGKGNGGEPA